MAKINDLPYELLDTILTLAGVYNAAEIQSYTYGLSELPRPSNPLKKTVNKYLRGRVPADVLKWNSVDPIRKTCSLWHQWALEYAVKEVYVKRWRGGESWDSTWLNKDFPRGGPNPGEMLPVVYKDPYAHVRNTARLTAFHPTFASSIRTLSFSGIYIFDSVRHALEITKRCTNLRSLSVPWSTLRYWDSEDWNAILRPKSGQPLEQLEFVMMDFRIAQCTGVNLVDTGVLKEGKVDFSGIRKLKIRGTSNVRDITDIDLEGMALTMKELHSLQITHTTGISWDAIKLLMNPQLRTLVFQPRAVPPPKPTLLLPALELSTPCPCTEFSKMPLLNATTVHLPTICPTIFSSLPRQSPDFPARLTFSSICPLFGARSSSKAEALWTLVSAAKGRVWRFPDEEMVLVDAEKGWEVDVKRGTVLGVFKEARKAGWLAPAEKCWDGERVGLEEFWEGVKEGLVVV